MLGDYSEHSRNIWVPFRNDGEDSIPGGGVFRIDGIAAVNGQQYLKAKKPNTYGAQYGHWVNGQTPVAAGAYGMATQVGQFAALYDTADGTPAYGEHWGPRSATYKLKKNTGGFFVLGVIGSGMVLVRPAPFLTGIGKADSAISQGNSGTVSVWAGTTLGSESDTGDSISVYSRFGDIESGAWVLYRWVAESNGYEGVQTPCPA